MNSIISIFSRGWDFALIVLAVMIVTQIAKKPILKWAEHNQLKAVAENVAKKSGIKNYKKLLIYVIAFLTATVIYVVYWGLTRGWNICLAPDLYIAAATAFAAAVTLYEIGSRLLKGEDLTKGMDEVGKTIFSVLQVVVAPLNTKFAAEGKTPIKPEQLQALIPILENNVRDVGNITDLDKASVQLALTNILPADTCKVVAEFVCETLRNSALQK